MRSIIILVITLHLIGAPSTHAQVQAGPFSLGVFGGLMNYQGDLNPNSFTLARSKPVVGLIARVKIHPHINWRTGILTGTIMAADRYNRDYLQPRNLSFQSSITEIHSGLEVSLTDVETKRLAPYAFGGVALFRYNPWTYDEQGEKVFLQPLGTEGQGLAAYPDRKKYQLNQLAMAFGGGVRIAVSHHLTIGLELSQRKTFTDYLDDVSSTYVDEQLLLEGNGPRAVELAFRGDELPGNNRYPGDKEIRGTPTEKDWYYFVGLNAEINFDAFRSLFGNLTNGGNRTNDIRCPQW